MQSSVLPNYNLLHYQRMRRPAMVHLHESDHRHPSVLTALVHSIPPKRTISRVPDDIKDLSNNLDIGSVTSGGGFGIVMKGFLRSESEPTGVAVSV